MPGVIPTLSLNNSQLTDPKDQIAYIIRHAFYNPGWTSSQIEHTLVSIRSHLAKYGENREQLLPALQSGLQRAVESYQPGYAVHVTARNITAAGTYTLVIRVQDAYGNLVLSSDDIGVVDGKITIRADKEK